MRDRQRSRRKRKDIAGQECGGAGRVDCKQRRAAQKRQQKGAKLSVGGKGRTEGTDLSWGLLERPVKEGAGKGEGRDGRGRWETLRAGTMPGMPQHPQGVPCSGPGVQEVLRRRLLTLNASRSQGARPVPPATLLSGPCVLMVAKVTCGAAPSVPSAPPPAPLAAASGAGPAPWSSGAYV